MFRFRRTRADREFREAQRAGQAMLAMHTEWPLPDTPAPAAAAAPAAPETAVAPDFLPPDFRRRPARMRMSPGS